MLKLIKNILNNKTEERQKRKKKKNRTLKKEQSLIYGIVVGYK